VVVGMKSEVFLAKARCLFTVHSIRLKPFIFFIVPFFVFTQQTMKCGDVLLLL